MEHGDEETNSGLDQLENSSPKYVQKYGDELYDDDGHIRRTGNIWTASAHVITAVIGSGVLSLAWGISQLGWIAGPIVMVFFAIVTYYMSVLLADCYRFPDPVFGRRNYTYMDAIRTNLGPTQVWICGFVQYSNLWATSVGYTITASISMVAVKRSNCFHLHGHQTPCHISNNPYMATFGIVQIILSQMPDFHRLWWLSIVAAVMSCTYAGIGLGLGIEKAFERGHSHGSIMGVSPGNGIGQIPLEQKVWQVFQALGNIAFAYSFSAILIEIQDTLKSPPAENKTMKKATMIGVSTTTFFYLTIGCMGYAAFGNAAPGNLLTGFGFYDPYWLVSFANVCIVVHLVGAYQIFAQPIFCLVETWASKRWPKSRFINEEICFQIPILNSMAFNLLRLTWRPMFVITTTLVAMLLPLFNDIVGLVGAYGFWPLTVYFPITMYISQKKIKRWSSHWIGLQSLSGICLLVSIAAALGSLKGIFLALKHYKPFHTNY